MRRTAALLVGPIDAGGADFAERRQRRIAQALANVSEELWWMLGGPGGQFDVDVGTPAPGAAPSGDTASPTVEVRTGRGEPAPPEVVARVRKAFDGVWARMVAPARSPRLPG
jgi:hypothetical protein